MMRHTADIVTPVVKRVSTLLHWHEAQVIASRLTSTACSQWWECTVAQSQYTWDTRTLPGGSGAGISAPSVSANICISIHRIPDIDPSIGWQNMEQEKMVGRRT